MNDMENAQASEVQDTPVQSEMVPRARVEELIKKAKLSAADKARLEMEDLHRQELEQLRAQPPQGVGGQSVDVDKIYSQIREKLLAESQAEQEKQQEEQRQEHAKGIAKTFFDRIGSADREAYKDFDEVTSQMDISKHANLVGLMTEFDNTAEMLYDLANNSSKLADMSYHSKTDPQYAYSQLKKLSESIKTNKQIKEAHPTTNPPLSSFRPSANAGMDGGNKSISDLRKMKNLRG